MYNNFIIVKCNGYRYRNFRALLAKIYQNEGKKQIIFMEELTGLKQITNVNLEQFMIELNSILYDIAYIEDEKSITILDYIPKLDY